MRPALRVVHRTLALLAAVFCLSVAAARAAEPLVRADLDGDGLHDRITRDRAEPSLVHIWLSTTRTSSIVRFAAPLAVIAAVDLDGDRRAELVASDQHAGLHVWTRKAAGFRPVHPKSGHSRGLVPGQRRGFDDEPATQPWSDSNVDVAGQAAVFVPHTRGAPPRASARVLRSDLRRSFSRPLGTRGPRPPPAL